MNSGGNTIEISGNQEEKTTSFSATSPKKESSEDDANATLKQEKEQKQFKQQFKMTITFFYIGVFFISVALPSSIVMAVSTTRQYLLLSSLTRAPLQFTAEDEIKSAILMFFQGFYGAVFLLNPILYSYRHPYIKSKIRRRKGLRYYCRSGCCFCCSANSTNADEGT